MSDSDYNKISNAYNDIGIRVEVVVVLASGYLGDINVHATVVAPVVRPYE